MTEKFLHTPVRSLSELDEPDLKVETVECLADTRLLWWDTSLIRLDFPALADAPDAVLEAFILGNASVLSQPQSRNNSINTAPPLMGAQRQAWRPPMYGRALLIAAMPAEGADDHPLGLLDLKGTGVAPGKEPLRIEHRNGLLILEQGIEEILYQRLVETVFRCEGLNVRGVPVYALIGLGFQGRMPETGPLPTAIMVRRAHRRFPAGRELQRHGNPNQKLQLAIELVLRHYGLTTCNLATRLTLWRNADGDIFHHFGGRPTVGVLPGHLENLLRGLRFNLPPGCRITFEGLNVQTTRDTSLSPLEAQLVDFGHYRIQKSFSNPIFSIVGDRYLNFGGVFWPQDPSWVQPDPGRAIDWQKVSPRSLPGDLRAWVEDPEETVEGGDVILNGVTEKACRLAYGVSHCGMGPEELERAISGFVDELLPEQPT